MGEEILCVEPCLKYFIFLWNRPVLSGTTRERQSSLENGEMTIHFLVIKDKDIESQLRPIMVTSATKLFAETNYNPGTPADMNLAQSQ